MKRVLILPVLCLLVAACGSSKQAAPTTSAQHRQRRPPPRLPLRSLPSVLQGEAQAAATGDIPDNQVFVVFSNTRAGYSIKYPEGWAQSGSGKRVTIYDKNNLVRIVVQPGGAPTLAEVSAELAGAEGDDAVPSFRQPQRVRSAAGPRSRSCTRPRARPTRSRASASS